MKSPTLRRSEIISALSVLLAMGAASILRHLLAISSSPLDIHAGWRPNLGWLVILLALTALFHSIFHIFRPLPPAQQLDTYALALADLEAERAEKSKPVHQPGVMHVKA